MNEHAGSLRGLRVLVVDDDEDNREMLVAILEHDGASVTTAASAAEALRAIAVQRPHVLISDIGLPDLDGVDLVKRMRALPAAEGGDVPAIALTGFERVEDDGVFQARLTKPVTVDEILDAIARVLRARPITAR